MNISVLMRKDRFLADLKTSIVTYIPNDADRNIYFYGNDFPEHICAIPFTDLVYDSISGNIARYKFKSYDGDILRSIVVRYGTVKRFKISGKVNSGDSIDTSFIEGTVGSLASSSDLRFNRIVWSEGMNITITDLYLIMK